MIGSAHATIWKAKQTIRAAPSREIASPCAAVRICATVPTATDTASRRAVRIRPTVRPAMQVFVVRPIFEHNLIDNNRTVRNLEDNAMDTDAWYYRSFGQDYLLIYKHRDLELAYQEVSRMIAWLELPQAAEILDLCCGMGRHALALADFGYRVTGLDLSEVLLTAARSLDTANKVHWIQGDMRRVPLRHSYDAVVNLFTSFGYFRNDSENITVLKEMNRLLKPGGKWIIDYLNPTYIRNHLVPYSSRQTDGTLIEETRGIENDMVVKHIKLTTPDREIRTYREQVKLYEASDFEHMLANAKLQIDHIYGDTMQVPFSKNDSPRMIMVGSKSNLPLDH